MLLAGGIGMGRKGLNCDIIMTAATELIEGKGHDHFSLNQLAKKLDVKPSSLYKHINGIEHINTTIGIRAIKAMIQSIENAIKNKITDEAIIALAIAYRTFAKENPELYKVILSLPMADNAILVESAPTTIEPIMTILRMYNLSEQQQMHWQRILRSIMHGFVSMESARFFSRFPAEKEETYCIAINGFIVALHNAENK
jgi:AcrR family transcriptional regulator